MKQRITWTIQPDKDVEDIVETEIDRITGIKRKNRKLRRNRRIRKGHRTRIINEALHVYLSLRPSRRRQLKQKAVAA